MSKQLPEPAFAFEITRARDDNVPRSSAHQNQLLRPLILKNDNRRVPKLVHGRYFVFCLQIHTHILQS